MLRGPLDAGLVKSQGRYNQPRVQGSFEVKVKTPFIVSQPCLRLWDPCDMLYRIDIPGELVHF